MSSHNLGGLFLWGLIIYYIFKFFSKDSNIKTTQEAIALLQKKAEVKKPFLNTSSAEESKDNSTKDVWMLNLWRWADENNIGSETIPRQKDKLLEITVLQLFSSQLTTLPKEIGKLTNLREIRLKGNQLAELPVEIGNLTNLEFLSLGSNNLTSLPEELGKLTKLKSLWIGANDFSEIPKIVWSLNNLTGLSLSRNNFTVLPKEIGNLNNLRILLLSGNNFPTIPAEIGNLSHLKRLDICHTDSLIRLPKEIGNLTSLEHLTLFRNSITELPKEIGNLKNLKNLYCLLPNLIEVPKEIGNLKNLLFLYLSGDSLVEFPKTIGNLKNLRKLTIGVNPTLSEFENIITLLPEEIGNLTNLIRLELPWGGGTEYSENINKLLETIKEKKKTQATQNSCYLKIDMDHAKSFAEDSYLNLSIEDIYTEKGTFEKECILKILAQNFHKEIEKIEKRLSSENVQVDTFGGFKILAAVDDKTMITVSVKAGGWTGLINNAYGQYSQEKPPTIFKYINEEPYFDDLLNSNEPFWNGLRFSEVVLLHFKKIMKELTKDAVLVVSSGREMIDWYVTDFEEFQKNPHITQIEKIIPVKERKEKEAQKTDENLQKNENVIGHKKIYLEVTLTPDRYLDHSGLEARKELFSRKVAKSLIIYHDSSNIYDNKAIKVFYDHTDIGFIMKKGSNGKVDEFCFDGNNFLEDVELMFKHGKLVLVKNEEKE